MILTQNNSEEFKRQFAKRLKDIREVKNLAKTELAKYIGISPNTLQGYEKSDKVPDIVILRRLATCLNVPIQFFIDKNVNCEIDENVYTIDTKDDEKECLDEFSKNFQKAKEEKGETWSQIAKALNITATTARNYATGFNTLSAEKLCNICEYLNVTADYLLKKSKIVYKDIQSTLLCDNCIHKNVCYTKEVSNDIENQIAEFGCKDYLENKIEGSSNKTTRTRKGKWETPTKEFPCYDWKCSVCGCEEYRQIDSHGHYRVMKFCPNCGAEMEAE